jgi:hypothetical protein
MSLDRAVPEAPVASEHSTSSNEKDFSLKDQEANEKPCSTQEIIALPEQLGTEFSRKLRCKYLFAADFVHVC